MTRRQIALDALGVVGVAFVIEGAREVYKPAAWIIAGLVLVAFAWLASRENE